MEKILQSETPAKARDDRMAWEVKRSEQLSLEGLKFVRDIVTFKREGTKYVTCIQYHAVKSQVRSAIATV